MGRSPHDSLPAGGRRLQHRRETSGPARGELREGSQGLDSGRGEKRLGKAEE